MTKPKRIVVLALAGKVKGENEMKKARIMLAAMAASLMMAFGGISSINAEESNMTEAATIEMAVEAEEQSSAFADTQESPDVQDTDANIEDVSVEQPAEEAATETSLEQPAGDPTTDITVEQATEGVSEEEPIEEQSEDAATEIPAEQPSDEFTTEIPAEQPFDEVIVEIPAEQPSNEEIVENSVEQPSDEEIVENPVEQPSLEIPAEQSSDEEIAEIPADQSTHEPDSEPTAEDAGVAEDNVEVSIIEVDGFRTVIESMVDENGIRYVKTTIYSVSYAPDGTEMKIVEISVENETFYPEEEPAPEEPEEKPTPEEPEEKPTPEEPEEEPTPEVPEEEPTPEVPEEEPTPEVPEEEPTPEEPEEEPAPMLVDAEEVFEENFLLFDYNEEDLLEGEDFLRYGNSPKTGDAGLYQIVFYAILMMLSASLLVKIARSKEN